MNHSVIENKNQTENPQKLNIFKNFFIDFKTLI